MNRQRFSSSPDRCHLPPAEDVGTDAVRPLLLPGSYRRRERRLLPPPQEPPHPPFPVRTDRTECDRPLLLPGSIVIQRQPPLLLPGGCRALHLRTGTDALFQSRAASRKIRASLCRASKAISDVTPKSGQPVPAPKTPSAASRISRLAITSLRKQTRTERMFASPSRDAIRQNHADWVRQQGRDTDDTHNVKPWGPVGDVPDNRAQPEKSHRRASLIPFQALARARAG